MKNSIDDLNNRIKGTEKTTSKLDDRITEITQPDKDKSKQNKKPQHTKQPQGTVGL